MSTNLPDGFSSFLNSFNAMVTESLRQIQIPQEQFSNALKEMSHNLVSFTTDSLKVSTSMKAMCEEVQCSLTELASSINAISASAQISVLSDELNDWAIKVVGNALKYMPEEDREECEETIIPELKRNGISHLSIGEIISLIGILVTVFFSIISMMSDKQLDRIIEQNDRLIAIEEEQLEIERNRTEELQNTAQELADIIARLSEEVDMKENKLDVLSDQIEDMDNFDVLNDQSGISDCQSQDGK